MTKKNAHRRKRIAADEVRLPASGRYDVVVVGGGAAGLAAAISAAQTAAACGKHLSTVVLEQGRRIGASIMRAGNGRCNFSNSDIDAARYWNAEFVQRAFDALDADPAHPSVLDWFADLGLVFSELPGMPGPLYPASRRADSVLAVLQRALEELDVEVCPNIAVAAVERAGVGAGFELAYRNALAGDDAQLHSLECTQAVFAAGGRCALDALSASIPLVERRPVLAPLAVHSAGAVDWEPLDGLRTHARVSCPDRGFDEEGELLFRAYGVSGIVAFNASRYLRPGDELTLDLVPALNDADLDALLEQRHAHFGAREAQGFLDGFILPQVARAALQQAGFDLSKLLSLEQALALGEVLKSFPVVFDGVAEERSAQVQRGGIDVSCVDAATFEVEGCAGLHAVGEALDVDGPCGGYNLHWAWTSGIAAGQHAALTAL